MSKHKIRYILPLLAVMASSACVGAKGRLKKLHMRLSRRRKRIFVPNLLTKWMKIV